MSDHKTTEVVSSTSGATLIKWILLSVAFVLTLLYVRVRYDDWKAKQEVAKQQAAAQQQGLVEETRTFDLSSGPKNVCLVSFWTAKGVGGNFILTPPKETTPLSGDEKNANFPTGFYVFAQDPRNPAKAVEIKTKWVSSCN